MFAGLDKNRRRDRLIGMGKLVIRKARRSELAIVQDLNYQLFAHDKKFPNQLLNMHWTFGKIGTEYFKNKINGKWGVCFVAVEDGGIVGYLAGGMIKTYPYRTIKRMSELEDMLVRKGLRGRGIGERLFYEFRKWSKAHGAKRIKVSAAAGNSRAIKFYERVGFSPYAAELEYKIK